LVSSKISPVFSLVAFAAIHSLTASLRFKRLVVRSLGYRAERLYLPVYSLVAVLTILPLVYKLYKNPGRVLYKVPSPWRWLMVSVQLIASIIAPKAFLDAPQRFKIRSQLSVPHTTEAGLWPISPLNNIKLNFCIL
jgi:protein-S-isoprenylcysteine O-methyltransferase Ste14